MSAARKTKEQLMNELAEAHRRIAELEASKAEGKRAEEALRVKELTCLNDIGRKIEETPPVPEFLHWVAERIPPAMQHSDVCLAAVEFEGRIYGAAEAVSLPCQIVQALCVSGEVIGQVYISYTEERDFLDEESALLGDIVRRVSGYIESRRLFEQAQHDSFLMVVGELVKELDCLNDIGRKIEETPPIPEFLQWLTERIPPAMQYPDVCLAAVEFEGRIYGAAEAVSLPRQIVQGLRIGGELVGRLYISYTEERDFLDEESALLGDIVRRVSGYIESRRLFEQMEVALAEVRRLAAIVENHPDFIGTDTLDGQILYVNPAGLKMMGLPADHDVTPMDVSDFYLAEDAQRLLKEGIPAALEKGSWSAEANLLKVDGTTIPVEQVIGINYDADGKPYSFSITIHDITERKRAEEVLQKAYEEVEKQVEERTAELQREIAERERLQQEIIEAQQRALQELSTPIIPIMERIIVMPLIGSIDTMRAKDIMRALMAGIRTHRAKVVILDITGVPIVDSGVANHLNKTIQTARLKGAQTIVTGISDAVAEAIVDLGIDWSEIETLSDLQTGLLVALNSLGIKLTK